MRQIDRLLAAIPMDRKRKEFWIKDQDFSFWMTPLTIAERAKAQKQAKSDDATDFALQLLVAKAQDENGEPQYNVGDIPVLRNRLPAKKVEEMMLLLLGETEESEEDVTEDPKPSRGTSRKTAG